VASAGGYNLAREPDFCADDIVRGLADLDAPEDRPNSTHLRRSRQRPGNARHICRVHVR